MEGWVHLWVYAWRNGIMEVRYPRSQKVHRDHSFPGTLCYLASRAKPILDCVKVKMAQEFVVKAMTKERSLMVEWSRFVW